MPGVVPRLHFGLWRGLQNAMLENRLSWGIFQFPELPQATFTSEDVHQSAAMFENMAFKVVGF